MDVVGDSIYVRIWQSHIDFFVKSAQTLKEQWAQVIRESKLVRQTPPKQSIGQLLLDAACLSENGLDPMQISESVDSPEHCLLCVLRLLSWSSKNLELTLLRCLLGDSKPVFDNGNRQIIRDILFDVLNTQLIPNLFAFVIAPLPSAKTQREAAATVMEMMRVFSAVQLGDQPAPSETKLLAEDTWDALSDAHNLRDAIEVAIVAAGERYFQDGRKEDLTPEIETLHTLFELCLLLTSISETFAVSFVCESEDGITAFRMIGENCLNFRCPPKSAFEPQTCDGNLAHLNVLQISLLGYILSFFDILCGKVQDSCHILVDAKVHILIGRVLALPCRTSFSPRENDELAQVSSTTAGIATIQGLALQLLTRLTSLCFPSFGPALLVEHRGKLANAPECVSVQSSIISNVIVSSPFCEVVESGLLWLDQCIRKLGAHVVGMTATDQPKSSDRAVAASFFESITEGNALIHSIQEIIQNYLTLPRFLVEDNAGIGEPETKAIAKSKCAAAAAICLQGLVLNSPHELQVSKLLATRYRALCGLLLAVVRRNRSSHNVNLARFSGKKCLAVSQLTTSIYATLTVGTMCAISIESRAVFQSLLCAPSVLGAGLREMASKLMAEGLIDIWEEMEYLIAVSTSPTLSIFSDWHIHDESGTQLVASPALRRWVGQSRPIFSLLDLIFSTTEITHKNSVESFLLQNPMLGLASNEKNLSRVFERSKRAPTTMCLNAPLFLRYQGSELSQRDAVVENLSTRAIASACTRFSEAPIVIYTALHRVCREALRELGHEESPVSSDMEIKGCGSGSAAVTSTHRTIEDTTRTSGIHLVNKMIENGFKGTEESTRTAFVAPQLTAIAIHATVKCSDFSDSLKLITSIAHHYVGNVEKLRRLEKSLASSRMTEQRRVLHTASAQQTRCWSVRDLQPTDALTVRSTVVRSEQAKVSSSPYGLGPEMSGFDPEFMVQNLAKLRHDIQMHLSHLLSELEKCPIHFPSRRCLLNDLYSNVYPKLLTVVDSVLWVLCGSLTVKQSQKHPFEHGKNLVFNEFAAKAIYLYVHGEGQETTINARNLMDIHSMILSEFKTSAPR